MFFLRIYGNYVKMFLKSVREFRAAFILYSISVPMGLLVSYASLWIILRNFADASGSIGGWSYREFVLLFSLNTATSSLACILYSNSLLWLGVQIRAGLLDTLLLRPMSLVKQLICNRFGDVFLSTALVGLGFLIWTIIGLRGQLNALSYLYLALALVGGFLLQSGAMILCGSISFWYPKSDEVAAMFYYGVREFIEYPLSIFPKIIRVTLTFVIPYAFINYYPCLIILHKANTGLDMVLGLISPLVGAGVFALSLVVFKAGLKRYNGTGS